VNFETPVISFSILSQRRPGEIRFPCQYRLRATDVAIPLRRMVQSGT